MVSCVSCGGTDFKDEGYQNVCIQCGIVAESLCLVNDNIGPLMSTFMKYQESDKGVAYRKFKQLYISCTVTLNTRNKIIEEGQLLLPQMWDLIKYKRDETKRLFIFALLYLLYRQHHVPVTFTQFLKQAHVPQERLTKIVHFVMETFRLPMFECTNVGDITTNSISELVKLVFKESTKEKENDTLQLAQRLVDVIYMKEWGDTNSKNYMSLVAIISTLLAAQYVVSNMTDRKTKSGRKACFRFMTVNYQKLADHMGIHVMAVKTFLKVVQRKLFKIVQKLPWTAACIKRSVDVARILIDLLNYIDIDVGEEDGSDKT